MSFEVFVLGTSGMMPLPGRFLTSAMLRRNGELFLFDCGEGTQVSLKMLNLHWKKISSIFITHMHADHVTGLPGLLMLSSQVERNDPLYIYGPPKLQEYIDENRRILDMYINYEIIIKTVSSGVFIDCPEYSVEAVPLLHTKPCFGYVFKEKDRKGEFYPDKARELGIPMGRLWGTLQNGSSIRLEDGREIHPSEVMGKPRAGRKFSYITDTMYLDYIADSARDSDLLLCEGMFTNDLLSDAREKKHMTSSQAAMIAKKAHVAQMGLIHYSPRYSDKELKQLLAEAKEIFPSSLLCKDRMVFDIPLKDEPLKSPSKPH